MYLIAKGLMLKEKTFREQKKGKYPDSPALRRGLNELYLYAMVNRCVDEKGDVLAPRNETEALLDYLSKPVKEWMDKWPEKSRESARDEGIWEWDNLVEIIDHHRFTLSDFGEDLRFINPNMVVDMELSQQKVYHLLMTLDQEKYEMARRFLAEKEHRLLSRSDLKQKIREHEQYFDNITEFTEIINMAYEECPTISGRIFRCGHCGWTVEFNLEGRGRCQHERCRKKTNDFQRIDTITVAGEDYLRLQKGVARYISYPGDLELEIERRCRKLGVQVEMWPEMDTYDVKLTFADGEKWCVDAKDYANPFLLKDKIEADGYAVPHGDWMRGFIVVPNDRGNTQYCQVVNRGIRNVSQQDTVQCVKLSKFFQLVKEKVNNGMEGDAQEM